MRATIEDLEALKELNDELEENHMENEKQMQAEIDHKDMLVREYVKRLEIADEANADYENTINQFRELVCNLQSDLEQLRQKEESQYSESKNLSSQSRAMLNLNFQLQSTVLKAQAKQIDLELRKLDAAQALENLAFVQPYLPDNFFQTDNDSIRCLLLWKRLVFKSDLIIKQMDQVHNVTEKLNTVVPEELISVCVLKQKLAWFSDLGKRFVSFMSNCPVETFVKMGQVYHELIGTEKRLHHIVDLLRKEDLKESEYVIDVQRSIAQLEHLAEIYLLNTKHDDPDKFYAYGHALEMNADTIAVTLGHLKQAVVIACKDEEIQVADSFESFNDEFFQPLQSIVSQARSSKVMVNKLLRRLDDLIGQSSTLRSEFLPQFKMCSSICSKLTNFCQEVNKGILEYINKVKDTKEELSLVNLHKIIYQLTEDILSINELSIWEGCTKSLQTLCQEINNLSNVASDIDNVVNVVKTETPWVVRSKQIKAEVLVNVDMERKLQQSGEEIRELRKEVKLKDQALQENGVKIDLLEKRMDTYKKQAEMVVSLEEELANSRKHENAFEEAMESLQQELEGLENENKQFKDVALKIGESGIGSPPPQYKKDEHDDYSNGFTETDPLEIQRFANQKHLKNPNNNDKLLKSVSTEAKSLLKDFRTVSASPRVVDLTKVYKNRKQWMPLNKKPDYQYQAQQTVLHTLQQRTNELKSKLHQLGRNTHFQKPPKGTAISTKPPFIGRIRVPQLDNNNKHSDNNGDYKSSIIHNIKLKTPSDFENIHTVFVN
ncbi:15759_t:CDS:10 [Entrophospora sp. SA101]|nr:5409_t:CDS:10 [Entrophospora sp. SA101]CAJ0755712.1 15759_t:CDS:10 [Entrophospora sp. SA101]CAJ0845345.1 4877_t:CDS:10 [Entrophospora sp. SA101]CAJ0905189.1 10990_t:CDS:10 [Entrophospora sp. SA101]